jgi:hypothetical protein
MSEYVGVGSMVGSLQSIYMYYCVNDKELLPKITQKVGCSRATLRSILFSRLSTSLVHQKKTPPDGGIEPPTTRLKVGRSTN